MTNLNDWITKNEDVALVLRQKLVPVEGKDALIFPPTYADATRFSPDQSPAGM